MVKGIQKVRNRIKTCVNIGHFYREKIYRWHDYLLYKHRITPYVKLIKEFPITKNESLLIVCGRGMNILWAAIWTISSLAVRVHGYKVFVLTTTHQEHLNRYFRLLNLDLIFYDDLIRTISSDLPEELAKQVEQACTFNDFRDLFYKETPIGQIALSTYTRYTFKGAIDLKKSEVRESVVKWIKIVCQAVHIAEMIYEKYTVKYLYISELFFEEYSGFYYTALSKGINIIKFTGTVRDQAFILQHMNKENERLHHAALASSTWEKIKKKPFTEREEKELKQNFIDRYGNKWHRSYRNHRGTKIMPADEVRKILGVTPGRKIAVIYSHILYDSLFFFGTDLFDNYAQWLVESVRVACENDKIDWFIKVHPSNIWRGELNTVLKGKYEEEKLIEDFIGELPPHIRIIYADTKINPYAWFQVADFGITVRGTSGLEMAALGKIVITAGTGRYEGNGFTIDPKDKEEYLQILRRLPDIPSPTPEQVELAKRYAYGVFILKPFEFDFFEVDLRTGVREVYAADDLIYLPRKFKGNELPGNLKKMSEWICDPENLELLSE
jgi:hypothetical protein